MYEYEGVGWIQYEGGATFVPVCERCGRFVKPNKTIRASPKRSLKDEPNATCSKCGPTKMVFRGFL